LEVYSRVDFNHNIHIFVIPGLTRDPVDFQMKEPLDAGSGPA
jgi:hypothetical protein